jgi:hypothetical protein
MHLESQNITTTTTTTTTAAAAAALTLFTDAFSTK